MRNYKKVILFAVMASVFACTPEEVIQKDTLQNELSTDQNDQTADPDLDPND